MSLMNVYLQLMQPVWLTGASQLNTRITIGMIVLTKPQVLARDRVCFAKEGQLILLPT